LRPDTSLVAVLALTLATVAVRATAAGQPQPPPAPERPAVSDIARAIEIIKADPNLATERTFKTLRWRHSGNSQLHMPGWLDWVVGLFHWLDQSTRVVIWGAAVVLAALLVVFTVRVLRTGTSALQQQPFVAPTHVRDLDIRPETLPADVGAAASALWDRGEHRAALALLYRGLLSRFAHIHQVPIRASSTEGDCLALASTRVPQLQYDYAARLVCVWQTCVYARQDVASAVVQTLCDDFAPALDRVETRGAA
jgi:hypothetical protein